MSLVGPQTFRNSQKTHGPSSLWVQADTCRSFSQTMASSRDRIGHALSGLHGLNSGRNMSLRLVIRPYILFTARIQRSSAYDPPLNRSLDVGSSACQVPCCPTTLEKPRSRRARAARMGPRRRDRRKQGQQAPGCPYTWTSGSRGCSLYLPGSGASLRKQDGGEAHKGLGFKEAYLHFTKGLF